MKTYLLPAGTPLQKISYSGAEFVPKNLAPVVVTPPFTLNGEPIQAAVLPPVVFTEDYEITTDETKTLKDSSGNVYEFLVGSRPKHRKP